MNTLILIKDGEIGTWYFATNVSSHTEKKVTLTQKISLGAGHVKPYVLAVQPEVYAMDDERGFYSYIGSVGRELYRVVAFINADNSEVISDLGDTVGRFPTYHRWSSDVLLGIRYPRLDESVDVEVQLRNVYKSTLMGEVININRRLRQL